MAEHQCHRCGATLPAGTLICTECGARQKVLPTQVRCRYCGHAASSELTLCPACGRHLEPAGFPWRRVVTWALVAVLALGLLFGRNALATGVVTPVRRFVSSVLRPLPSTFVAIFTPTPTADLLESAATNGDEPEPTVTLEPTATDAATTEIPTTPPPTATATPPSLTDTPAPVVTETPVPATAEPTATSTAEATATPTGAVPTETPAVTLTPGIGQTYKVRSGDTLESIARQFGVTIDAIVEANNLTNPNTLSVDQELIIPPPGAVTTATATAGVPPATPLSATPTAATAYSAPALIGPDDGATVEGGADTQTDLRWAAAGTLSGNQFYQVTFTYKRQNGGTWSQWFLSRSEAMRLPRDLYGTAQGPDRVYAWAVRIVRLDAGNNPTPLSPASDSRTLRWP